MWALPCVLIVCTSAPSLSLSPLPLSAVSLHLDRFDSFGSRVMNPLNALLLCFYYWWARAGTWTVANAARSAPTYTSDPYDSLDISPPSQLSRISLLDAASAERPGIVRYRFVVVSRCGDVLSVSLLFIWRRWDLPCLACAWRCRRFSIASPCVCLSVCLFCCVLVLLPVKTRTNLAAAAAVGVSCECVVRSGNIGALLCRWPRLPPTGLAAQSSLPPPSPLCLSLRLCLSLSLSLSSAQRSSHRRASRCHLPPSPSPVRPNLVAPASRGSARVL